MATVLIIARDETYAPREAFRESGLFPVVVESAARALIVLAQFRVDVVVLERSSSTPAEWEPLIADLVGKAPVLTFEKLPAPRDLAEVARHARADALVRGDIETDS